MAFEPIIGPDTQSQAQGLSRDLDRDRCDPVGDLDRCHIGHVDHRAKAVVGGRGTRRWPLAFLDEELAAIDRAPRHPGHADGAGGPGRDRGLLGQRVPRPSAAVAARIPSTTKLLTVTGATSGARSITISPCAVVIVACSFCLAVMHIGCGPVNSWGPIWVDVAQCESAGGTAGSRALLTRTPAPATAAMRAPITRSAIHAWRPQGGGASISSGSTGAARREGRG